MFHSLHNPDPFHDVFNPPFILGPLQGGYPDGPKNLFEDSEQRRKTNENINKIYRGESTEDELERIASFFVNIPSNLLQQRIHQEVDHSREGMHPCTICCTEPTKFALIPCGHLALCIHCTTKLLLTEQKCPFCRLLIQSVVEIFSP